MNRTKGKIETASLQDLYTAAAEESEEMGLQVVDINIDDLYRYRNHTYEVRDDEEMEALMESISNNGQMVPITVRVRAEGGYEIIAGHRRKYACEKLGITKVKAIIVMRSDDEADIEMVDSNIYRQNVSIKELAYSYKCRKEAEQRMHEHGIGRASDTIARNSGKSGRSIDRLIKLTELVPHLMELVNDKKIAIDPGDELAMIDKDLQNRIALKIAENAIYPNKKQAVLLREYAQKGELTDAMINLILTQTEVKAEKIILENKKLDDYFPKGTSKDEILNTVYGLLDEWKRRNTDGVL